jgi:hypothetical protein
MHKIVSIKIYIFILYKRQQELYYYCLAVKGSVKILGILV